MLKLYNTLNKQKEEFKPINPGKVSFYACGPTVYNYAHIGNLKTFVFEDVLNRYLKYQGYEVRYIMNITDVGHLTSDDINQADSGEDKMLKAALREKKTPAEIADFYSQEFFKDIKKLNFKKANFYPRVTTHIPQIIKMVETLIEKGLAYEKNGNVFYDVSKFKNYGKLSGKKLEDLKIGARLEEHPDKKNPYDFALWLKAPEKHLMQWDSPWGMGYPGWHIECSAMSMEYLGETLDIHAGGEDHIFPHHENEIAQSEGITDKNFANFWLHGHFLLVDGKKMSKSKGNFYVLKDIEEKGFSPMTFRLFAISSHYRSQANFTWETLSQARENLRKISLWIHDIENITDSKETNSINLENYLSRFEEALNDDLNTPLALSVVFELITKTNKEINQKNLGQPEAQKIINFWKKINQILGLETNQKTETPENIQQLAQERKTAREQKDFQKSDQLREEIEKQGFEIQDKDNNEFNLIKK